MNYFEAIPAIQIRFMSALHGPIPVQPMGQAVDAPPPQGTTKPLCLCKLQREKDEARRQKKKDLPAS
jgi:hypothetical protein